jgi:hypothetical protein
MRLTIIKDDGVVGIDGVFKTVDLSGLDASIRALQWDGTSGHIEFYDDQMANLLISDITSFQSYVDAWNTPPVVTPPTAAEMIASAQDRISAAYQGAVDALTAGYPQDEIASWPKQETEARAWLADNTVTTPWIDAAASSRGIAKADFVNLVIGNADALAPLHGALTGKRQKLRDEITALGSAPTQAQLDAIQW